VDACSAEAKVAAMAVAFTSFFGTFDGGVGALCEQPAAFAKTRAIR